jgi:hypothetical protein
MYSILLKSILVLKDNNAILLLSLDQNDVRDFEYTKMFTLIVILTGLE